MADQWYIARANKKHGPYSSAQMKQMAGAGQLLPSDMVLQEGTTKWAPVSQVPGLLTTATAPTPPPIPTAQVAAVPSDQPAVAVLIPPPIPTVPPSPAQPAQAWSQLPPELRPVLIGMASVVGLAVLLSLYGITVALGDNADVRNQVLIFLSFVHGIAASFAIYYMARLQRYDVALLGSLLVMTVWGWYLFATIPLIVTLLGIAGGFAVGCWSLAVLRKPDMRSQFREQELPGKQQWQRFSTPALTGMLGGGVMGVMTVFGLVLWLAAAKSPGSVSGRSDPRQLRENREVREEREVQGERDVREERIIREPREVKSREMPAPRKIKSRTGDESVNDDNPDSTGMEQRYKALVFRITPGMSKAQVEAILGSADQQETQDLGKINPQKAGQTLDIWTWRDMADSKSFIMLSFINGRLEDGGTPGYDIRKGFTTKLP